MDKMQIYDFRDTNAKKNKHCGCGYLNIGV
jgi:hypothetical protein